MSQLEPTLEPAVAPTTRVQAGIAGLGRALPPEIVENGPIAEGLGVGPEWIERRTGIQTRRRMAPDGKLSDLSAEAAERALAAAGIAGAELDCLLVATCTADRILPNEAPLVAERIGAQGAMAWDVGLACTGFIAMLAQGSALIESGRAQHVLAIGAEGLTRRLDYGDKRTAPLFADGAGAAVLSAGADRRIGTITMGTDAEPAESLYAALDDQGIIHMDGHVVFQHAVARMTQACQDVLAKAELTLDDIDLVIPHQANSRIIVAVGERLGLPAERVVDYVAHLGNTSGASLPLALSLAEEEGRLPENGRILLCAFGAGLAWGATIVDCGAVGA